jgi:hypothetical protein
MQVMPLLTQTTAGEIAAGHLFAAQTAGGSGGLFIRAADGETTTKAFADVKSADTDVTAVQLAPRSTELNWIAAIPADAIVSDVTDAVALAYDVTPENLRYPNPALPSFTALVAGDLLVDGNTTKLVFVGPNPAIGIAFIDLDSGEITLGIGPKPMQIVSWWLDF